MQTLSSDEKAVRPYVYPPDCPSVCQTRGLCKTEERSVQIFIPYEISFSSVFSEEEWLVRGDLFYPKFQVNWPPLERNRRF